MTRFVLHGQGFENSTYVNEYLLANPETVLATVAFTVDANGKGLGFSVQTNSSVQWFKGDFQDPNMYIQVR